MVQNNEDQQAYREKDKKEVGPHRRPSLRQAQGPPGKNKAQAPQEVAMHTNHRWGISKRYSPGSFKASCRICSQTKRVTRIAPGKYRHEYLDTGRVRILTQ